MDMDMIYNCLKCGKEGPFIEPHKCIPGVTYENGIVRIEKTFGVLLLKQHHLYPREGLK